MRLQISFQALSSWMNHKIKWPWLWKINRNPFLFYSFTLHCWKSSNKQYSFLNHMGLTTDPGISVLVSKHLDQGLCLHLFGWQLRNGPRKIRWTDVERNQGPHSAWTVPSCTAYHSSGPESSVQTQTFLFCGSSLNAPHLSHRILFWPWVFPSNAVPPACSFQGNVHTHPLFKISIWYTKVINLKKINTQSVQWITYSSIIF